MKGNEMIFEIIYIRCGFIVIQVKASNSPKMTFLREQRVKRRFKQHNWIKLMHY